VSPATVLNVRVTPRAGRTTIAGWQQPPDLTSERASPTLLVKLAAAPADGAANDALIALLARGLDLPTARFASSAARAVAISAWKSMA
jgi:uncharacterized protein